MTIGEVKRELNRVRLLQTKYEDDIELLARLRSQAEKVTPVLSDMPSAGGGNTSRVEEYSVKMVDLQNEIADTLKETLEAVRELQQWIDTLGVPEEQRVLTLRYVCCYKWETVMEKMCYSWGGVHKVHKRALRHLAGYTDEADKIDFTCSLF